MPGWAQHGAGYKLSNVGGVQGTNWVQALEYVPLHSPQNPLQAGQRHLQSHSRSSFSLSLCSGTFLAKRQPGYHVLPVPLLCPCCPVPLLWVPEQSPWQHRLNSTLPSLADSSVVFQEPAPEPWAADMHVATDALCRLPKAHPVCAPTSG